LRSFIEGQEENEDIQSTLMILELRFLNSKAECLHTVKRIFDYKEALEDKKVKLAALRFRKYASLWWTNPLCKKG